MIKNRYNPGDLDSNGEVYFSEGNYDYYIEKKSKRNIEGKVSGENVNNKKRIIKSKVKKLTWKEKKELEIIEEEIIKAEEEVEKIESIFSSKDFYEKYASKTKELNAELSTAKELVSNLYNRWEELEKIIS